jgi:small subunit ribosomal protein S21
MEDRKFHTRLSDSRGEELELSPLQVKVQDNFDRAFKAFRAIVQKERILSEFKRRGSYEKPSNKKRRKKSESLRKLHDAEIRAAKIASGEYEREIIKKNKIKEQKMALRAKKQAEENS